MRSARLDPFNDKICRTSAPLAPRMISFAFESKWWCVYPASWVALNYPSQTMLATKVISNDTWADLTTHVNESCSYSDEAGQLGKVYGKALPGIDGIFAALFFLRCGMLWEVLLVCMPSSGPSGILMILLRPMRPCVICKVSRVPESKSKRIAERSAEEHRGST